MNAREMVGDVCSLDVHESGALDSSPWCLLPKRGSSRKGIGIQFSDSADEGQEPARTAFQSELDQLRLQVEVMALKVDEQIRRAVSVLLTGDEDVARTVVDSDDEIDDMLVSLTERCYDLLARQNPVAVDLRLVVSVIRILGDLERTGDLCLRIVKLCPDQPLLAGNPSTFDLLKDMSREALDLYRLAIKAWASLDLSLALTLDARDSSMDEHNKRLMEAILALEGPMAVPIAVKTLLAGRALERIADHSVMVGERIRYMLTGDIQSLSREVGPNRES
ncbi:MAG: phosphate signaling complex protein PhoU [Actinobacteria bacterium]|nr:phosphate signaling complex protein PhoU [Actinomycetota bacterium]